MFIQVAGSAEPPYDQWFAVVIVMHFDFLRSATLAQPALQLSTFDVHIGVRPRQYPLALVCG